MLPLPPGHKGEDTIPLAMIGVPILVSSALVVAVHPLLSVTVTAYMPAVRPVRGVPLLPLDHAYLKGALPLPPRATEILPLDPAQVSAYPFSTGVMTRDEAVSENVRIAVQCAASVTVTV